jgi:hypothetical protein
MAAQEMLVIAIGFMVVTTLIGAAFYALWSWVGRRH